MKQKVILALMIISIGLNILLIYEQNRLINQKDTDIISYIKVLTHIKGNLKEINSGNNDDETIFATKGMLKSIYLIYPEVINTPAAAKYHSHIFDLFDKGEYSKIESQLNDIYKIVESGYTSENKINKKDLIDNLNTYFTNVQYNQ
ncbi:hypothetical protein ACFSCX_15045 [Bacillus salitolerans]|uniref:Uncharacterized protein n=1 Tax=Bacillus salitolerans TaxID=1437434 RepID=A0ABW4LS00_9BACI